MLARASCHGCDAQALGLKPKSEAAPAPMDAQALDAIIKGKKGEGDGAAAERAQGLGFEQ